MPSFYQNGEELVALYHILLKKGIPFIGYSNFLKKKRPTLSHCQPMLDALYYQKKKNMFSRCAPSSEGMIR